MLSALCFIRREVTLEKFEVRGLRFEDLKKRVNFIVKNQKEE